MELSPYRSPLLQKESFFLKQGTTYQQPRWLTKKIKWPKIYWRPCRLKRSFQNLIQVRHHSVTNVIIYAAADEWAHWHLLTCISLGIWRPRVRLQPIYSDGKPGDRSLDAFHLLYAWLIEFYVRASFELFLYFLLYFLLGCAITGSGGMVSDFLP